MMDTHSRKNIDECIRRYREALLSTIEDLENEDYVLWESYAQTELEEAIEEKVKMRILADIAAWLRNELPL